MAVSLKKSKIKYYYNKLLGLSNSLLKKKYLPHFDIINSDRLDRIIDRTRFKNRAAGCHAWRFWYVREF